MEIARISFELDRLAEVMRSSSFGSSESVAASQRQQSPNLHRSTTSPGLGLPRTPDDGLAAASRHGVFMRIHEAAENSHPIPSSAPLPTPAPLGATPAVQLSSTTVRLLSKLDTLERQLVAGRAARAAAASVPRPRVTGALASDVSGLVDSLQQVATVMARSPEPPSHELVMVAAHLMEASATALATSDKRDVRNPGESLARTLRVHDPHSMMTHSAGDEFSASGPLLSPLSSLPPGGGDRRGRPLFAALARSGAYGSVSDTAVAEASSRAAPSALLQRHWTAGLLAAAAAGTAGADAASSDRLENHEPLLPHGLPPPSPRVPLLPPSPTVSLDDEAVAQRTPPADPPLDPAIAAKTALVASAAPGSVSLPESALLSDLATQPESAGNTVRPPHDVNALPHGAPSAASPPMTRAPTDLPASLSPSAALLPAVDQERARGAGAAAALTSASVTVARALASARPPGTAMLPEPRPADSVELFDRGSREAARVNGGPQVVSVRDIERLALTLGLPRPLGEGRPGDPCPKVYDRPNQPQPALAAPHAGGGQQSLAEREDALQRQRARAVELALPKAAVQASPLPFHPSPRVQVRPLLSQVAQRALVERLASPISTAAAAASHVGGSGAVLAPSKPSAAPVYFRGGSKHGAAAPSSADPARVITVAPPPRLEAVVAAAPAEPLHHLASDLRRAVPPSWAEPGPCAEAAASDTVAAPADRVVDRVSPTVCVLADPPTAKASTLSEVQKRPLSVPVPPLPSTLPLVAGPQLALDNGIAESVESEDRSDADDLDADAPASRNEVAPEALNVAPPMRAIPSFHSMTLEWDSHRDDSLSPGSAPPDDVPEPPPPPAPPAAPLSPPVPPAVPLSLLAPPAVATAATPLPPRDEIPPGGGGVVSASSSGFSSTVRVPSLTPPSPHDSRAAPLDATIAPAWPSSPERLTATLPPTRADAPLAAIATSHSAAAFSSPVIDAGAPPLVESDTAEAGGADNADAEDDGAVPDDDALKCTLLLLTGGLVLLKHGRRGFPHRRLVWVDARHADLLLCWGKPEAGITNTLAEVVPLTSVVGIQLGFFSAVIKRSGKASRSDFYLTLELEDLSEGWARTLDLEAESPAQRDWLAAQLGRLLLEDSGLIQACMLHLFQTGAWQPLPLSVEPPPQREGFPHHSRSGSEDD